MKWANTIIQSLLLLGCLGLSGCEMMGAGTDNTPAPSPLPPLSAVTHIPKFAWEAGAGSGSRDQYLRLNIAPVKQWLVVADPDGTIKLLNQHNGLRLWRSRTGLPITTGPVADASIAIVATNPGEVAAVSIIDGKSIWKVAVADQVLALPHIANNDVFVKTINGHLVALDAQTGAVHWEYVRNAPLMILQGGSAVQVIGDRVIAGFSDGHLVALNRSNGDVLWDQLVAEPKGLSDIEQMVDINGDPVVDMNTVYVATYQGRVAAIAANTGEVRWSHELSSYTGLAVEGNSIVVTDVDGYVWCFDRATGHQRWIQKGLAYRGLTAPTIHQDAAVVADKEGYVHWLSLKDGIFTGRIPPKHRDMAFVVAPRFVGGALYLLTTDGRVLAYGDFQ